MREKYPDGRYEAGANIGPEEWTNLRIDIDETRLTAWIDGTEVLRVAETKSTPAIGAVGLFVDFGSESFFSNLSIRPQ